MSTKFYFCKPHKSKSDEFSVITVRKFHLRTYILILQPLTMLDLSIEKSVA